MYSHNRKAEFITVSVWCYLAPFTTGSSKIFNFESFPFDRLSIFNVFFIPKYVFWCGKPKNDNHFVEKPIIKCLFCIFVLIVTHMHVYITSIQCFILIIFTHMQLCMFTLLPEKPNLTLSFSDNVNIHMHKN